MPPQHSGLNVLCLKENCPGFSCTCIRKLLAEKDTRELNLQEALSASLHREHDLKTVLADKQIEIATLQGRVKELEYEIFKHHDEIAIRKTLAARECVVCKPTDPRSVSEDPCDDPDRKHCMNKRGDENGISLCDCACHEEEKTEPEAL